MKNENPGRRRFIRNSFLLPMGFMVNGVGLSGCSSHFRKTSAPQKIYTDFSKESIVSFVNGNDRYANIYKSLEPYAEYLKEKTAGKTIIIKLNCNRPDDQLIKTHPDAVRAVLDFLSPFYTEQILIGESTSGEEPTRVTYEHYGYYKLEKEYNAKLVELNDWPVRYHWILDSNLNPEIIGVLTSFLDPEYYIISVTPLKTHGDVVATLSLKNVVMGAPKKRPHEKINYKTRMHGGSPKNININIFLLSQYVRPDFAVLDGFIGAEGDGPNSCEPVDHKVAFSGPDFLAVDRIGVELMGIPWEKVGYLRWCDTAGYGQGDLENIHIMGPDPKKYTISYKLHKNTKWAYEWDKKIDWGLIHTK